MDKPRLIIVDDNESFIELFVALPECRDFEITTFNRVVDALRFIERHRVDLIISDVQMPEMDGNAFLKNVQDSHPDIPFILVTAFGSTDRAIRAIKQGAFHYFEKPLHQHLDLFWATVRQALAHRDNLREIDAWRRQKSSRSTNASGLIGQSAAIQQVRRSIAEVAELPITVLVTGETGTGKELVAKAIHTHSCRSDKPFFPVNCAEFATDLLESELFGHERGAFTGALEQKKGLFELSSSGTLLLDEICEAPMNMQTKLLRVLEDKHFKRAGGNALLSADCRIIAATNRHLPTEVAAGRFRQDLYYRINVYTIEIAPLRERREDIVPIAKAYLQHYNTTYKRAIKGFSEKAIGSLIDYEWPGNVRELVNVVERAVITCKASRIGYRHLPLEIPTEARPVNLDLKAMEKLYIGLALEQTDNNKTQAARLLNIGRKTLTEKLKKLCL